MDSYGRLPKLFSGFGSWEQDLRTELAELPATLRTFREAVANMQTVTKRLLDATEGIEQFTALTSQMGDARKHLDEAASSLRDRLTGADRGDVIGAAMSDVTGAISAMAELNPFLRPQKPAAKPAKRARKAREPGR